MILISGIQKSGNYLTCSIFSTNLNHWVKRSKNVACYINGDLFFLEIHRGKEGIDNNKYHQEATKGLGKSDGKGATTYGKERH